MAKTRTDFENEAAQELSGSYKTLIDTAKQNAATNKQTVNAGADASIKSIKDNNAVLEKETREDYENKLQTNEVQRVLNERYISRKAAEMGLTDSGLNRTQQTAVQLSYANQKGDLEQQSQKAIDTLAAAMQADIDQVNIKRNADLAGIDTTLNTNLANFKNSYINDVVTIANERYSTYLEDLRKQEEAKQKERDKYKTAYAELITTLSNSEISHAQKKAAFDAFNTIYGFDDPGLADEIMKNYNLGEVYHNPKTNEYKMNFNDPTPVSYTLVKTKDTKNGGGGIDHNDEITIVDNNDNVIKTLEIDKIPGLTKAQKKALTKLTLYDEIDLSDFGITSSYGVKNFINSLK